VPDLLWRSELPLTQQQFDNVPVRPIKLLENAGILCPDIIAGHKGPSGVILKYGIEGALSLPVGRRNRREGAVLSLARRASPDWRGPAGEKGAGTFDAYPLVPLANGALRHHPNSSTLRTTIENANRSGVHLITSGS